MKNNLLFTIVLCFKIVFLTGQTIICAEHICEESIHREEFLTAIKTYKDRYNPRNNPFPIVYLVDFFQEGNLNKYRIYGDLYPCAPLFRQPDCIVRLDVCLFFLYTPDYRTPKDSLFLDILERNMSNIFLNQKMEYNWETMTISNKVFIFGGFTYSPSVTEYIFQEGRLIDVKDIQSLKMYYEDLYIFPSPWYDFGCRYICPSCPTSPYRSLVPPDDKQTRRRRGSRR